MEERLKKIEARMTELYGEKSENLKMKTTMPACTGTRTLRTQPGKSSAKAVLYE
jgi:hypothetical protein